jgi:heme/copper-type cytochrome/quinol oxidase subunit 2
MSSTSFLFSHLLSISNDFMLYYSINFDALPLLMQASDSNLATRVINYTPYVYDNFQTSHLSAPNIKLYYPEPFIASPTFSHDDIWFLHITIYQYWLWFFFCFIIIFFFLTFLITVRWCNIRHKPIRETRGVSRSKCGDLITATVPVTWAASIIIHESTDAIELADGFGTSELAIGIRAYQWGWEYYYPRDLNLMLKERSTSVRLGSSLAYWSNLQSSLHLNKFKSYLYNNSPSNTKLNNSLIFNYSFLTNSTSDFMLDINASNNKLIPRFPTNLITSSKLFSLHKILYNDDVIYSYKSYSNSFFNFISGKSQMRRTLFDYTDANSLFNNNLSNLNYKDFKLFSNYISLENSKFILNDDFLNNTSRFIMKSALKYNFKNLLNNLIMGYTKHSFTYNVLPLTQSVTPQNSKLSVNFINGFLSKISNNICLYNLYNASNWFFFFQYSNVDFRRWSLIELLEESIFSENFDTNYFFKTSFSQINKFNLSALDYSNRFFFNCTSIVQPILTSGDYLTNSSNNQYVYKFLIDVVNQSGIKNFFSKKSTDNLLELLQIQTIQDIKYAFQPLSIMDIASTFTAKSNEFLLFSLDIDFNPNFSEHLNSINFNYFKNLIYLNNSLNLASNFKNLMIFYQSFWKVFKTSIEEERSNFNFSLLSQTSIKLPVIHDNDSVFFKNYNKNSTNLYTLNTFKHLKSSLVNYYQNNLNLSWDFFFLNFPFATAFDSDIIRFIWFDWYSMRGQVVTKSLDTSVFNLYGVKDYDYAFNNNQLSKYRLLNVSDNYFSKFAQARNFYLPKFQYTPILLSKILCFNIEDYFINYHLINELRMKNFTLSGIATMLHLEFDNQITFNMDFNPFNLTNKRITNSVNLANNQLDVINDLNNINMRRLYLISSMGLSDTLFTHFLTHSQTILTYISNFTNPILSDNLYSYSSRKIDNFTIKNPYQPLKKGIHNMIRIQADKAIAMPTDTRLQILAVSKDIIHSWSVPSAGIKIDCIPGYSSHRILMFSLSGIYWGQCMEICGRFHHWMPIVVYFIRRDLFCIWCVHFVFKNQQLNSLYQLNEFSNIESNLNISYDYSTWVSEF